MSIFSMSSVDISEKCKVYSQESFKCNSTNFNGLSIISSVISSLNKNVWKFAPFIDGLNKKPEIIVFSEVWFNERNFDNFAGHKAIKSVRTEKKTGGGLSIFL